MGKLGALPERADTRDYLQQKRNQVGVNNKRSSNYGGF